MGGKNAHTNAKYQKGYKKTDVSNFINSNLNLASNSGDLTLEKSSARLNFKQKDTGLFSDITQEEIDNLRLSFQKRSAEVLQRNSFQGREQLILTDRA